MHVALSSLKVKHQTWNSNYTQGQFKPFSGTARVSELLIKQMGKDKLNAVSGINNGFAIFIYYVLKVFITHILQGKRLRPRDFKWLGKFIGLVSEVVILK